MHRSMARTNVKMQALSGDDKAQVLRKLQGSPHFEKTLSASTVSRVLGRNAGMTLPSWFVQKHGDKFRQSATLRTESSTKAWTVGLSIYFFSTTWIQVRFSAGWKAFVTSNGLVEGDYLVFALTAMSEFEVYVFRSAEKPGFRSQARIRKWANDSERSRKKGKQSFECREEQLVEGSSEGEAKFDGSSVAKTKSTVADEGAASASGPQSPTSIRNASFNESPNESQENLSLKEVTRNFLLPGFWKKLTASNICRRDGSGETACLEIPLDFWKMYGSRIQSLVKLQGIHEESPVRTMACYTCHGKHSRHYLRAEWRDFVNENHLQVGQELFFAIAADSFFIVREALQPPS